MLFGEAYRKPSASSPVIHPGDETPFLVWGGEESALLDRGGGAWYAWNRCSSKRKSVKVMSTKQPKQQTPTFLLELPLLVEAGQAKRLRAHLEAGRQFYNAVLSEGQRRLRQMRADPGWQAARSISRSRKPEMYRCV